jgi:hypothetical protein
MSVHVAQVSPVRYNFGGAVVRGPAKSFVREVPSHELCSGSERILTDVLLIFGRNENLRTLHESILYDFKICFDTVHCTVTLHDKIQ